MQVVCPVTRTVQHATLKVLASISHQAHKRCVQA